MRSFSTGSQISGARADLVARIEEIKAAPQNGQKRLVVKEEGRLLSHSIIDITTKEARELEEHETYRFKVAEKNENRPGSGSMRSVSRIKSYFCDDAPENFDHEYTDYNRFGGGRSSSGKRTKF